MYKLLPLTLSFLLGACAFIHTKDSPTTFSEADKSASFATTDLTRVTQVISASLDKQGFRVREEDPKSGKILATIEKIDQLGTFNSGFSGGANYKIMELLSAQIESKVVGEETVSQLVITRTEKFSMGQEVSEELHDPTLYRAIFAQVKAGLPLGR